MKGGCIYCDEKFEASSFEELGIEFLKHRDEKHPEIKEQINKIGEEFVAKFVNKCLEGQIEDMKDNSKCL